MQTKGVKKIIIILICYFFIIVIIPSFPAQFENAKWERLTSDTIWNYSTKESTATTSDSVFVTYGEDHGSYGWNIHYRYLTDDTGWSVDKVVESRFACYAPVIEAVELDNGSFKIAIVFDNQNDILCSKIFNPDQHWNEPVNISSSIEPDMRPTIAIDNFGVIHLAWITELKNLSTYKLSYARENGDSWLTDIIYESQLGGFGSGAAPEIVLVNGLPHIFYRGGDYLGYKIHHAYKDDINGPWFTEILDTGNNEDLVVSAVVDSTNDIHLAIYGYDGWNPEYARRMYYKRWDNESASWVETIFISENIADGRISLTEDEEVFIVSLGIIANIYTDEIFLSTINNGSVQTDQLPNPSNSSSIVNPSVGYWPGHGGVLLLQAIIDGTSLDNYEIFYYGFPSQNSPPDKPVIDGATQGKPDIEYDYTFSASDPESDDILKYIINWGDNTGEENITGPYESEEEVIISHTWTTDGIFTIKVKAKDIYGAEGPWGELEVIIPRMKSFNYNFHLVNWFFERFPILEKLLNLLN
jgi:hypothetical protein